jgi:hypothetical protein
MRRISSLLGAALLIVAFLAFSPQAASAQPAPPTPAHLSKGMAAAISASNPCGGSPYACADGHFYAWNGNNGDRCQWVGNAPTLGECTNTDYLIGNDGYRCSGCDWIRLYWGTYYTGAYFCIPPGYGYGQATSPNLVFDKGDGLAGYGQTIWYNAASAKWSGPC